MNIKKEIKENKWTGQGINAVPLVFESATSSLFSLHKTLGFSYTKFYCAYKGKFSEGNYWNNDLERLAKILLKKLEDKKYLPWLVKTYFKEFNEAARIHKVIDKTDLKKVSYDELVDIAQKANTCIRQSLGIAHIIESFSIVADDILKEKLKKEIGDTKEFNETFSLLISPVKRPFIIEYDELLNKYFKTHNKKYISEIQKKFYWIKNNYSGKRELTEEIIIEESKEAKSFKRINYKQLKEKKEKIIKELKLSKELKRLIRVTEEFAYLRDERKKNSMIAVDYFCRVGDELIKRSPLTKSEFYYLLPQELNKEHLNLSFKKELRKRMKEFTLVNIKGKIHITHEYVPEKENENVEIINGMPTSLGTAVGRVKVCRNISQLGKVEEGDILVAPMTRPEYVPAMKKAAAIVTDEGGLTCHAAVIARELNKPCIIGTKIATKVLKDNDLVEVKAHHGTVRRIS